MSEFYYQIVPSKPENTFKGGPSVGGQAVGAGIKLLHKALTALNGFSVAWRTERELEKLSSEINAQMPAKGGVLVCVGIEEWKYPDPTGFKAKGFLSIHIAGVGSDREKVLKDYLSTPVIVQGPSKGWVRKNCFIWVTRKGQ